MKIYVVNEKKCDDSMRLIRVQPLLIIVLFIIFIHAVVVPSYPAQFTSIVSNASINRDFVNLVEYRAVLVAIESYPVYGLPYSINEMDAFTETLQQGGNWKEDNIVTLTNSRATKGAVHHQLQLVENVADENDVSLFYFIGHGGKNLSNEYIRFIDDYIYDIELDQWLSNISGKVIVILDSCYSGGFIEEVGKPQRTVLTACSKNEVTYQVADLRSGLYGYFLNLSFTWFTKNAEFAHMYTKIFTWLYCQKLSEEHEEDILIHPQMYDGISGPSRVIYKHSYIKNMISIFGPFMSLSKEHGIWNH